MSNGPDPLADALDEELERWRLPDQMFVGLHRAVLAQTLANIARRILGTTS